MFLTPAQTTLTLSGKLLTLERPVVMGIVNVTPDSFFAGSRIAGETALRTRFDELVSEGAAIADLGAYSSRPGADEVSVTEEMERLRPALRILRDEYPDLPVSVDTFRSEVSGGALDPEMYHTVAALQVPYILMHMKGDPQTMQSLTDYSDVTLDVIDYFAERIGKLLELGLHDIILDPGFGFSKTTEQNYELLMHLDDLTHTFTQPILVGVSRKSMIYRPLGCTPAEALGGTTFLHALALERGAQILRVHDVRAAAEAITLYEQARPYLHREEHLHYSFTRSH